jgi:hypothetical protein
VRPGKGEGREAKCAPSPQPSTQQRRPRRRSATGRGTAVAAATGASSLQGQDLCLGTAVDNLHPLLGRHRWRVGRGLCLGTAAQQQAVEVEEVAVSICLSSNQGAPPLTQPRLAHQAAAGSEEEEEEEEEEEILLPALPGYFQRLQSCSKPSAISSSSVTVMQHSSPKAHYLAKLLLNVSARLLFALLLLLLVQVAPVRCIDIIPGYPSIVQYCHLSSHIQSCPRITPVVHG